MKPIDPIESTIYSQTFQDVWWQFERLEQAVYKRGRDAGLYSVASNLLEMPMSIEKVSELTGLSIKDIEQLQAENNA